MEERKVREKELLNDFFIHLQTAKHTFRKTNKKKMIKYSIINEERREERESSERLLAVTCPSEQVDFQVIFVEVFEEQRKVLPQHCVHYRGHLSTIPSHRREG